MSAPTETGDVRLPRLWRRGVMAAALTVAITMIVQGAFDATKSARRLPPQTDFIPTESQAFVITSSLTSLWSNFSTHVSRLDTPEPSQFWADVNGALRELSTRCIAVRKPEDLRSAGLDPARGLSASVVGGLPLVALPVSDHTAAFGTLQTLSLNPVQVRLSGSVGDGLVEAFRISVTEVNNGVLCAVAPGAPFHGNVQILSTSQEIPAQLGAGGAAELDLFLAPRGPGRATAALICEAVLGDGQTVPCACTIDDAPCVWPYESLEHGDGLVQAEDAKLQASDDLWGNEDWGVQAGFVGDWLLLSTSPNLIRQAVALRAQRRPRLIGDDQLIGLIEHFRASTATGEAALLGVSSGILEPAAGVLPFAINASPERVQLRTVLPIDTFRVKVLDDLISAVGPPPGWRIVAPLSVRLNDPALGSYYTVGDGLYARRQAKEGAPPIAATVGDDEGVSGQQIQPCEAAGDHPPSPRLSDRLGNFAPLVEGLAALEHSGPLEAYLIDVRHGVPEIVLVQGGQAASTMDRLIRMTQTKMRRTRDIRVLCLARADFWSETGGPVFPVYPDSLLHYLGREGPSLLDRYNVQSADIQPREQTLDDDTFEASAYRANVPDFDIYYLPPPFAENDERYLLNPETSDDVDIAALRQDAYRLAYARLADGSVVFGTDAGTVQRFLEIPSQVAATTSSGDLPSEKLSIQGNPEDLVALALLHPDGAVRALVTTDGFEVLDQYGSIDVALRPASDFDGLVMELRLGHD